MDGTLLFVSFFFTICKFDTVTTVISCLTKWAIWDKVKLSKYRGIGCHTDVINNLI